MVSKTNDGSHSEIWDCWGDCWWYTQEDNKLFRTGEFRKEYGECELGPKCPNHPKFVQDSLRKYQDRSLLPGSFPIRGLQDAINKYLFEKECRYTNFETGSEHRSKRAIKYDLNFASLPWILCVGVKDGECCSTISEIDFELQLMNVNFTLSAIIWGDAKTHLFGNTVDMNREKHIYYDGMVKE